MVRLWDWLFICFCVISFFQVGPTARVKNLLWSKSDSQWPWKVHETELLTASKWEAELSLCQAVYRDARCRGAVHLHCLHCQVDSQEWGSYSPAGSRWLRSNNTPRASSNPDKRKEDRRHEWDFQDGQITPPLAEGSLPFTPPPPFFRPLKLYKQATCFWLVAISSISVSPPCFFVVNGYMVELTK